MKSRDILKTLKEEELSDSFVLPNDLTPEESSIADKELLQVLEEKRRTFDETKKVHFKTLQFKYLLEDYINNKNTDQVLPLNHFTKMYLETLDEAKKDFANKINLKESTFNRFIKGQVFNHNTIVDIVLKLGNYSNNTIPPITWFRVWEKQLESKIINCTSTYTDNNKKDKLVYEK